MKRAFLGAALIIASSVAFADTTSVLLDGKTVRNMSAEEYAAAVRGASDVEARDKEGRTPLHYAAWHGTPANIAALLSAGADVKARNTAGMTILLPSERIPANPSRTQGGAGLPHRRGQGPIPMGPCRG